MVARVLTWLQTAVVVGSLAACGGGGGGDERDSFRVSLDKTSLSFEGDEGGFITPQVLVGSGNGTPNGNIYTGSIDQGDSIGRIEIGAVGEKVTFTVYPKSTLAAGRYTGSIRLFACPDVKCANQFAGSPFTVPYTINVRAGLKIAPAAVYLNALSGDSATSRITVSRPDGQASYTASTQTPWLIVSDKTDSAMTLTATAMPPGNYLATVTVNSGSKTLALPVQYQVTGNAATVTEIKSDLQGATFTAVSGAPTAGSRTFNITLPSWSKELSAELVYPGAVSGWLTLEKTGPLAYTVSASASALPSGSYPAMVVFRSGTLVAPLSLPVNFAVGPASWSVAGIPTFTIGHKTTVASLTADIAIDLPGLPSQGWKATTASSWLKLGSSTGMTRSNPLRVSVDGAALAQMKNFASHNAEIVISSLSGAIPPYVASVTLVKQLPEINFVSPHTRLPGEAGPLIVRGRGFDGVQDLQQAIAVSGTSVASITRVNDTKLILDIPGAPAGVGSFKITNTLGETTATASLLRVAQGSFSKRVLASKGVKGALFFDPERQSLYAPNKSLGTLMRFAHVNGDWTISAVSIPAINSAAMAPDGKSIVATSTNGKITLVDPSTLAVQATYTAGYIGGYLFNTLPNLAITNNGKVFFEGYASDASGMLYFDLVTRSFGGIARQQGYDFYSGPWFSVSGDGERLLIVQSASISPSPSMLMMDSGTERPESNPVGITFWYEAAQSLRGERFMEGTYKVWDRDFNFIGNSVIPDSNYSGRTPIFSPDGNRAYVMTYPASYQQNAGQPRVYVFDSSTKSLVSTDLPVLGYFDLDAYPTCASTEYECNTRAQGTISPDGKTLFFAGDERVLIVPIPTLTPVATPVPMQRAKPGSNAVPRTLTPLRLTGK